MTGAEIRRLVCRERIASWVRYLFTRRLRGTLVESECDAREAGRAQGGGTCWDSGGTYVSRQSVYASSEGKTRSDRVEFEGEPGSKKLPIRKKRKMHSISPE